MPEKNDDKNGLKYLFMADYRMSIVHYIYICVVNSTCKQSVVAIYGFIYIRVSYNNYIEFYPSV